MSRDPRVTEFIDDEEKELIEAIEAETYAPGESLLTDELAAQVREAARNHAE